ncbi:MAG: dockerin type I repeat-containing protein [candidate division Zixibacteria bacterium]|nr:dockerin type I repeat-containing protein [candidate division Zixibacteria bacterium]
MLLRTVSHCEFPAGTKQSVYSCSCGNWNSRKRAVREIQFPNQLRSLFILFLFLLLSFTPFNNPYSQTLHPNPDSIPFAPAVNYSVGGDPFSVFCADLDGDTDLDLAVANRYSDNVCILLNLSNYARPDSFSLIFPTNYDSVKTPVTLSWQKSIDPDPNDTVRYGLYLSRSIVFNPDSTIIIDSLLDTDFTDSLGIKNWYWEVKAYDKWGAVRWSDQTWSLYVYLCGDCNGDGFINVADVVYAINYLFKGGPSMKPLVAGEVNCDGKVTVSDVVYTINYLFKGGPKPCQGCP